MPGRLARAGVGVVVFFAGALGACGARAATLSGLPPGARLVPGSVVEITWPPESARDRDDELELVLSLDGGQTFPLRVTRRIDPSASRFRWSVPSLPAEHALLALRGGRDEGPDDEHISAVSEEFAIERAPDGSLEEILWVRGEGRTRDALDSRPAPALPRSEACAEFESRIPADLFCESVPRSLFGAGMLSTDALGDGDCAGGPPTAAPRRHPSRPSASPRPLRL